MRSASIKRAAQATVLDNLCAAKQDFKPRSELGFLPVENGQTGLSAPKIEAPDLMRLPCHPTCHAHGLQAEAQPGRAQPDRKGRG